MSGRVRPVSRAVGAGVVAGAAGTAALNLVTYLDMAVRGRPSSSIPGEAAARLAGQVGVDLPEDGKGGNRREGMGALLGYLAGLGVGAGYGFLRRWSPMPWRAAAVPLGLLAMAGSDVPLVRMGLTDPRTWGPVGWASDVVPHLAYGAATAAAFDLLAG